MKTKTNFEFELAIEFDYEPPQRQTYTDPSFPAAVEIGSVTLGGHEILECLTPEQLDQMEDACWQEVYAQLDSKWDEPPERDDPDEWYDADGTPNPKGAYDAGGHHFAERDGRIDCDY